MNNPTEEQDNKQTEREILHREKAMRKGDKEKKIFFRVRVN